MTFCLLQMVAGRRVENQHTALIEFNLNKACHPYNTGSKTSLLPSKSAPKEALMGLFSISLLSKSGWRLFLVFVLIDFPIGLH